ncbi:unnamed protein product [Lactuca virosa]|uniref:Uncharacterized protein n=1 Tax=Lactuca virosa TaxID=75947 RepID=A0AAU9PBC7_9ASTR|nr:unnamed protein product [Lactuca virosa]
MMEVFILHSAVEFSMKSNSTTVALSETIQGKSVVTSPKKSASMRIDERISTGCICEKECEDELSVIDQALDEDFIIPLFDNVEDDEAPAEEEPLNEEQEEEENVDEAVDEQANDSQAEFKYSTHDPNVKWNRNETSRGRKIRFKKCDSVRLHCVCASDSEEIVDVEYKSEEMVDVEYKFERGETSNTVPPQKRVNEKYKSEEMVDVDVVSDGDGLDMIDMDYIIEQITELRKSGYTDVEIMRCLGITKAHLEEFGYVAANVEGGLEGDVQGNEEQEGHGQGDGVEGDGDGVEGGGDGQGNEEEGDGEGNEEDGEGDGEEEDGEVDGEEEDGEGDGEEDEVEGVEVEVVQGNEEGGGVEVEAEDVQGNEEGVPLNDPIQQGHFGNNMQQRTRRPSERIILQKLKKKVVDPLGI